MLSAPEKPRNLTLQVLTPDHKNMNVKFINVKLSWQPPVNTRNGSDIIRYILLYRKEPPYDVVNRIEPHNAKIIVNDVGLFHFSYKVSSASYLMG